MRGRYFTDQDGLEGARAVIVSESVARRFWPGEDALGRRIYMGTSENRVVPDSEIVGIVADVKQTGLEEERPQAVYAPHRLVPLISNFTFAVRTSNDPISLAPDVYTIAYVPFKAQPIDSLIVAISAILISFLATLYPSSAASRLQPVEALRYE